MNKALANRLNKKEYKYNKTFSPRDAEAVLMEGNRRFLAGNFSYSNRHLDHRLDLYTNGQTPFAAIVTCADSRLAPEILFDQGLGDLFVIRNAGNLVGPLELGSLEYAVQELKVPLIMVLGHNRCGAIQATLSGQTPPTSNLRALRDRISPSVEKVKSKYLKQPTCSSLIAEDLASKVEDENILNSAENLLSSPIIKNFLDGGRIKILAAKYEMQSGQVKLLKTL